MNNNIYSPTYQYNVPAYLQHNDDELDQHFSHLLGQSQSRYTAAQSLTSNPQENQETFHSTRMFVISTLDSYGIKIGTLPYSKDNQITLKCILNLITQKQKDTEYKTKIKQQLNAANFQKDKYESLLKQSKNNVTEKQRFLGKVENECTQLKKKIKLLQTAAKKEKNDDQKMIMMLKSKNDLLLHQIKKKEVEILRVKDQMKRAVVTKTVNKNQSPTHNKNEVVKNSFELIEKIQRLGAKGEKWKKNATNAQRPTRIISQNADEEKFSFMMDNYEREKKIFVNENILLREKVYEMREILVKFAEWIEVELFGQSAESASKYFQKRFICNHNLMLSKNALLDDLNEVINSAKGGIVQLQERLMKSQSTTIRSKSISSPTKKRRTEFIGNPSSKMMGAQSQHQFKKKSSSIRQTVTFNINSSPMNSKTQKSIRAHYNDPKVQKQRQDPKQRLILQKWRQPQLLRSPQLFRATYNKNEEEIDLGQSMPSQIRVTTRENYFNELQLSAFENDLLSDIYENSVREDPDHSIGSHVSTNELLKEIQKSSKSGKYDKWQILFRSSGDERDD